ncbi:hypothetical protein [Undibacterium sp.]|uniref:hypothetical protein n=1 Tax=Undibacterium sp. TaxID=1914977 RepID=UPI003753073C
MQLKSTIFYSIRIASRATVTTGKFALIRSVLALFITLMSASKVYAVESEKRTPIRIQDLEKTNDPIAAYIVELLDLVIKKSGNQYFIVKSKEAPVPQVRQILEMSQNIGKLDVIWTMTSDEREQQILPIRIPIDKGFFGWRIPFVNRDNPALLHGVKTFKDLSKFNAGQGFLWPDTEILRSNGLPVITGSDESLANMLRAKRFDYFPRPVIAIWNEKKNAEYRDLEIDTAIILHYPTAFYFFVAPQQKKLAADLTRGLEKAVADGSFEHLFNRYFQSFIRRANIKDRVILELKNPLIKDGSLPLKNSKLWFRP